MTLYRELIVCLAESGWWYGVIFNSKHAKL